MLFGTGISMSDVIGLGVIGLFCLTIWLHARSYLGPFGTVTSDQARLDNPAIGGDGDGGYGGCGDGGVGCGDGGH